MKNKIVLLIILIALIINFAGCGKKHINNNLPVTSQTNQSQQNQSITTKNDLIDKKDNINQFFFRDISSKNQFIYKGTVWGDNILDQSNEEVDSEGSVYVKAILTVSEIAKLRKGIIYLLDFDVKGDKNNTEEKNEKVYLWVTEDKIYYLSPPIDENDKNLYENGSFNYLKYAEKIEESGQLPSNDKNDVVCSNDDMKFINGAWEIDIEVKNNTCTYDSYNEGNYSYTKFVWEVGKGLINYQWGQGASAAGMDLNLVE